MSQFPFSSRGIALLKQRYDPGGSTRYFSRFFFPQTGANSPFFSSSATNLNYARHSRYYAVRGGEYPLRVDDGPSAEVSVGLGVPGLQRHLPRPAVGHHRRPAHHLVRGTGRGVGLNSLYTTLGRFGQCGQLWNGNGHYPLIKPI